VADRRRKIQEARMRLLRPVVFVRLARDKHPKIKIAAMLSGKSISAWAGEVLVAAAEQELRRRANASRQQEAGGQTKDA
jgi:hypothetical protein